MSILRMENDKCVIELAINMPLVVVESESGTGKTYLYSMMKEIVAEQSKPNFVFVNTESAANSLADDIHDSVIVIDRIENMSEDTIYHVSSFLMHNYRGEYNNIIIFFARSITAAANPSIVAELHVASLADGRVHFSLSYKEADF